MSRSSVVALAGGVCLLFAVAARGQVQASAAPDAPAAGVTVASNPQAVVPRLMKFNGVLRDTAGKPVTGPVDVTFALYSSDAGGDPLWFETQSVQTDEQGRYTALIGVMHDTGLPAELFASGEARWLGVQVGTEAEQKPRVLLLSVPYALKAADAETLGGMPASAFVLSGGQGGSATAGTAATPAAGTVQPSGGAGTKDQKAASRKAKPLTSCGNVTGDTSALAGEVALYSAACVVTEDANFVDVSGKIGIGTASPSYTLDVAGYINTSAPFFQRGTQVLWTDANNNTMLGIFAGNTSMTGTENTFVGRTTGSVTTSGGYNTGVGGFALSANTTGQNNTGLGFGAGDLNQTGSNNTAIGQYALVSNTASANTAVGSFALRSNTSGTNNTAVGYNADYYNATATDITAVGYQALLNNTANYNTAVGSGALQSNTTGGGNTALGYQAAYSNTANYYTTAVGYQALMHSTAAIDTAVGSQALNANTIGGEVAVGYQSLYSNTSGPANVAMGNFALSLNTTGGHNVVTGDSVMSYNTTGSLNVAIGDAALAHSNGGNNTGVGGEVLYYNTTGSNNTALGYNAGLGSVTADANTTGSNNTFVGYNSAPGTSTQLSNATALGANATVSASNALVLGNGVNVGIGTSAPTTTLQVSGGDVSTTTAGDGLIVKSPDGTKCARIGISNTGALAVTSVTCP